MIACRHAMALFAIMLVVPWLVTPARQVSNRARQEFHAITPTGYNIVQLMPSGRTLETMGLIECPEIDGLKLVSEGLKAQVVSAQGIALEHFPRHFTFRVTATLRKVIPEPAEGMVETEEDPQRFLLHLKFRLKAYDGLHVHAIAPEAITMIGVPEDVSYDERVFRIEFNVEELPVTDRVVLELLSPEGEPVSHFVFMLL